jgi:hypothetical protein
MSEIIITKDNLPKFSRRLQKVLLEHFKQDISLTEANLFFAQTMGKKNIHELHQVLVKSSPDNSIVEQVFPHQEEKIRTVWDNELEQDCHHFIDYINNYFTENQNHSHILDITAVYDVAKNSESLVKLYLKLSIKDNGIWHLHCSPNRFLYDLNKLDKSSSLTKEDQKFLEEMDGFFNPDSVKTNNPFLNLLWSDKTPLAKKLIDYLKINQVHREYCLYSKAEEMKQIKLYCQPFIQYVQSYFSRNKEKSEIIGFSVVHDIDSQLKDSISLKIYVKPTIEKKHFGFISCSIARFSADLHLFLNEFDISNQDETFLKNMDFFFDDRTLEKLYFSIRLKKYLNIDGYHQEYSLYSKEPSNTKILIKKIGFLKQGFLIDYDQDPNMDIPYLLEEPFGQTKWADISSIYSKNKIIDNFEEAFKKLDKKGGTLWQCCYKPYPRSSDSKEALFMCSSFYMYKLKNGSFVFSSINGYISQIFIKEKGIAFYKGILDSLILDKNLDDNPYYVNENEFKIWVDGFNEGLAEKIKNIKTKIPRNDIFHKNFSKF